MAKREVTEPFEQNAEQQERVSISLNGLFAVLNLLLRATSGPLLTMTGMAAQIPTAAIRKELSIRRTQHPHVIYVETLPFSAPIISSCVCRQDR
jgi:hypothetical protein